MADSSSPIRTYRDLIVWQRAVELAAETYRLYRLLHYRIARPDSKS
jgi:hypothetical protein